MSSGTSIAPHGSWRSAITSDLIAAKAIGLPEVRLDGDEVYWQENRPQDNGRCVVVRGPSANLGPQDVIEQPYSARTRVHEYGGGAWTVSRGTVYFSNDRDLGSDRKPDRRLYRQERGAARPTPMTPDGEWRYADGIIDRLRNRWIGVREDHSAGNRQAPENTIVAVDLDGAGNAGKVLISGHDFFSSPRLSPDGRRLAWLAWDHPFMPWVSTNLYLVDLGADGMPTGAPTVIAGSAEESVLQPEWAPDGSSLLFVSDRTGWWNLYGYELDHKRLQHLVVMEAEFGEPQWSFGMSNYAFAGRHRIAAAYTSNGLGQLAMLDLLSGRLTKLDLPFTEFWSVRADGGDQIVFGAGGPDLPASIVSLDAGSGTYRILKQSTEIAEDPEIRRLFTALHPIDFPTQGGNRAFAFYYPPFNPDFTAPPDDKPPLMVRCHGGPTAAASTTLALGIQFWTSRGIAVLDVNYGGSTGYGRKYRERLRFNWGVVDVEDCENAAKFLVEHGLADERRIVITGASSGGYTSLAALTFGNYFQGGASYSGISDPVALAKDTHKFEAHYLDWLIGPYPEAKERYEARSPLRHASRLSKPMIFFQGDEDEVVPPAQTESIVSVLRGKGAQVGYLTFSGEQHGLRREPNIRRALDAELYFFAFEIFRTKLVF
jgi:dipeptidyl aminopeptidase/acylaminoacyl peptidase